VTEGPDSGGGLAASAEQRLRVLEDERDIRALIVRYAQCLDARDHSGYARLFARDGRWSGRMGEATGPQAIEEMLIGAFGPTPADFRNTRNFHLMSNIIVELDGDAARAESRLVYFARSEAARPVPILAGRYFDEFVREDGRWRFQSREVLGEIPTREEAPVRTPEEEGHER
jgi:uncharacterized protein (TIGR02246 family)